MLLKLATLVLSIIAFNASAQDLVVGAPVELIDNPNISYLKCDESGVVFRLSGFREESNRLTLCKLDSKMNLVEKKTIQLDESDVIISSVYHLDSKYYCFYYDYTKKGGIQNLYCRMVDIDDLKFVGEGKKLANSKGIKKITINHFVVDLTFDRKYFTITSVDEQSNPKEKWPESYKTTVTYYDLDLNKTQEFKSEMINGDLYSGSNFYDNNNHSSLDFSDGSYVKLNSFEEKMTENYGQGVYGKSRQLVMRIGNYGGAESELKLNSKQYLMRQDFFTYESNNTCVVWANYCEKDQFYVTGVYRAKVDIKSKKIIEEKYIPFPDEVLSEYFGAIRATRRNGINKEGEHRVMINRDGSFYMFADRYYEESRTVRQGDANEMRSVNIPIYADFFMVKFSTDAVMEWFKVYPQKNENGDEKNTRANLIFTEKYPAFYYLSSNRKKKPSNGFAGDFLEVTYVGTNANGDFKRKTICEGVYSDWSSDLSINGYSIFLTKSKSKTSFVFKRIKLPRD